MKKTLWAIGMMFVMTVSFSLLGYTQEEKMDQDKMMQAYMKMMAPNKNHEIFKDHVGEWIVMTKAWMQPGADPVESKNSAKIEVIMGGRFMKMTFKGTMFGQPFEGLQITGYDNILKKYVTFWIDSSSTSFYLTKGTLDETGKVMTEEGDWLDPMTGGTFKVRAKSTMISPDEFFHEMYITGPDGKEFKSLENRMTRKK